VFGDPNADGFEVLFLEEMARIEGEYGWVTVRQFISYLKTFGRHIASYRMRFGNHPPHHGIEGHYLELIIYRKGASGSHRRFIYDYENNRFIYRPSPGPSR